jgi:hypothetical protein
VLLLICEREVLLRLVRPLTGPSPAQSGDIICPLREGFLPIAESRSSASLVPLSREKSIAEWGFALESLRYFLASRRHAAWLFCNLSNAFVQCLTWAEKEHRREGCRRSVNTSVLYAVCTREPCLLRMTDSNMRTALLRKKSVMFRRDSIAKIVRIDIHAVQKMPKTAQTSCFRAR